MSRPRDIEPASSVEGASGSPGRSVIAAIGIDQYPGRPRLANAVADARGALAQLERLGFEQITPPLFDGAATGEAIWELVTDDLKALGPSDRLVLFYAGHGATRSHDLGNRLVKTGYLIPADASERVATWIELEGWLRAVSLLPARHILVIVDACHSGIALDPIIKWRDAGTQERTPLSTLQARRSRRIITSALDDQVALDSGPVPGHSLFTGCLLEALTHGIDSGDGLTITGSQLGLHLQHRVGTYPDARQTPDFGAFDLDDRGELVIELEPTRWDDLTLKDMMPRGGPGPAGEPTYTDPVVRPVGDVVPDASLALSLQPCQRQRRRRSQSQPRHLRTRGARARTRRGAG
ncbi:MAG TPA: caspase family protein [Kofleriaceae bacterium]|nr:caspase family protein [Kofleriaceae bacterium]